MPEHELIAKTLKKFNKVMQDNNVTFWLEYGTQLGAVREGKIIEWDRDGDVGVWLKDIPKMKALEKEFLAEGIRVCYQPSHPYIDILIDDKGTYRATVDIYTFATIIWKNEEWVVRIMNGELFDVRSPYRHYKYFRGVKFLGKLFLVPLLAEVALEFAYGPDWKTPIQRSGIIMSFGELDTIVWGEAGRVRYKKLEDL